LILNHEWSRMSNGNIDRAENVYEKLLKEIEEIESKEGGFDEHKKSSGGEGEGEGDNDSSGLPPGLTPEDIKQIVQTAVEATQKGKLPAGFEELVKDILDPKINWRQLLYRYIVKTVGEDVNWKRPNHYLRNAGYFPTYESEQLENVVVALDTSGSISSKDVTEFFSEVIEILRSCDVKSLHLIMCDAAVQSHNVLSTSDARSITSIPVKGRGGTDFTPVYKFIDEKCIKPNVLIYLTDGEGYLDYPKPAYSVIWLVYNNWGNPDFAWGDKIKVER
jgi:predicted metal-dependent peptidase